MPRRDDAQNANIAFTLVARNERARQMWADPHNSLRYAATSHVWQGPSEVLGEIVRKEPRIPALEELLEKPKAENYDQRSELEKKIDTEPALQFRFAEKPKDYAKGFLLGSDDQTCDVILGSSGIIDPEMLAFTYNKQYELIMNVTSIQHTTVKFNDQPSASRQRFSWILPRGQKMIRVTMARDVGHELVFDVVLPTYEPGSIDEYHKNCKPFIVPGVGETLIAEVFSVGNTAITARGGVAFRQASPFYLRKEGLGHGSFGVVRKVQRMPDGKIFAAKALLMPDPWDKDFAAKQLESDNAFKEEAEKAEKAFKKEVEKSEKGFKKEVGMLKLVCKTPHDNVVQFVDEWYGDHTPSMILDYMPGGTLQDQLKQMKDAQAQMEPGEIINISHHIMKALEFIHEKGIVHQDVKPGNILRKSRDQYMLADFGCAGRMGPVLGGRGTRRYMAPESDKDKPCGFEVDIWSLGVVILNCLDGLPTGDEKSRPEWCENLRQKVIDYHSLVEKYSDKTLEIQTQAVQLILLVQRYILQLNPADRMSAKKLLENFPSLWKQGVPGASSRIEEAGEQGIPGASDKIEEDGEFEAKTPLSVGGPVFIPGLDFEEVQVQLPTAPNADQGSHSDPPANNSPDNEVPALNDPIQNIPSGLSTPEGETDVPFLPGVGEKRKRGDRSSATDNGAKETIVPPLSPRNDRPPINVGSSSATRDQKRLRSKQSAAAGSLTPPQQPRAPSRSTQTAGLPAEEAAELPSEK